MPTEPKAGVDTDKTHDAMRQTFGEQLASAEAHFVRGEAPTTASVVAESCEVVLASKTQAYREVALGCLLTRIHQPDRNIRHPYVSQGEGAFNGRTLDERVVNPFLQDNGIPCSKGPYLSVFRRQASFEESTRSGLRDKEGFDALLRLITALEQEHDTATLTEWLTHLLWCFVRLREESRVEVLRLERISLPQYDAIVRDILQKPSGGLLPLLVVLAAVEAIAQTFDLHWVVDHQGINVADAASAVGGDITIKSEEQTLMVIEVTERPVDRSRLVDTFRSKIAHLRTEYVFMVHFTSVDPEAHEQASRYFAQGHEVNFVDITEWLNNTLASLGSRGRTIFQDRMVALLSEPGVPQMVRLAWNDALQNAI